MEKYCVFAFPPEFPSGPAQGLTPNLAIGPSNRGFHPGRRSSTLRQSAEISAKTFGIEYYPMSRSMLRPPPSEGWLQNGRRAKRRPE